MYVIMKTVDPVFVDKALWNFYGLYYIVIMTRSCEPTCCCIVFITPFNTYVRKTFHLKKRAACVGSSMMGFGLFFIVDKLYGLF